MVDLGSGLVAVALVSTNANAIVGVGRGVCCWVM